ncbi:OB-fold domain-containing protein [Mycobacterium sp. CVI_P3]|uniref:OB-fold domain-containing protein n=1 Tax=Mycobacterium pinniadriaticum TaxID=2994102 RepID=A0ABT3SBX6_9MYCO|nr:OB-fold domain-containing protein [Mycobacterium pinniadriaticum]MCX2929969.1 OB-fold domain-containing protein [Mycobacterium pinniadriaticum]MCX2936382.1 OB-fold domain-containing protein [Mycobacterium pinniadriaticum]
MDVVADGLVRVTENGPRLITSRCCTCQARSFPARDSCRRCGAQQTTEELVCGNGTLWTWTVQRFPPKAHVGSEFTPFGVGYVELESQLRIQGRLTQADPERLWIGMPMTLELLPEADGGTTYAFAPLA